MPDIERSLRALETFIESEAYRGYDCYDALNSPLLRLVSLPSKHLKIAFIQAFKICPINFRPVFGIKKGLNPKGLGLVLSATSKLLKAYPDRNYLKILNFLANLLLENASKGYSGKCWGYNFDWQSRVFYVPKFTPTIVNSSYVGHAFLDAYEATGESRFLEIARSTCEFILRDLHQTAEGDFICFSYTPIDRLKVHNANILGAGLLARVYAKTGEIQLREMASRSVGYVTKYQRSDGSWIYAETNIQQWVDSFHTGFVLESLDWYNRSTGDTTYVSHLKKGFDFFVENFFLTDGTPKYYNTATYPVDIHSAAQGIVTLSKLQDLHSNARPTLEKLLTWTIENMQDDKGYFYYQKRPLFTNKIAYMRWSEAWMYHALAQYLHDDHLRQTKA